MTTIINEDTEDFPGLLIVTRPVGDDLETPLADGAPVVSCTALEGSPPGAHDGRHAERVRQVVWDAAFPGILTEIKR